MVGWEAKAQSPISGSHVLRLGVLLFLDANPDAEKRKGVRVIVFFIYLGFSIFGGKDEG